MGMSSILRGGVALAIGLMSVQLSAQAPTLETAADAAATAVPPVIPTAVFAARATISNPLISGDGNLIATRARLDGKHLVVVFDAATRQILNRFDFDDETGLDWFRWAGNDKLLVSVSAPGSFYGSDVRYTRLLLVHARDGWVERLGGRDPVVEGDNVIHVAPDGSHALVSVQRTVYEYPSVRRYDLTRDGKMKTVQTPRDGVWNWYADQSGTVRIGTGRDSRGLRVFYRPGPDEDLKLVDRMESGTHRANFWQVGQLRVGEDTGYVLRQGEEGRTGLYLFDFAREEVGDLVFEHPEHDVETVWYENGAPLAAEFFDDRDHIVWFDADLTRHQSMLTDALPEERAVIVSRADDKSRMVVWSGGDSDPGAYYIYTPAEKKVDQFFEVVAGLPVNQLARPEAVTYTARDGTTIRAMLTLPKGREAKGLPLIVMPHGGPYGIRDTMDYNSDAQLLANRGYAVIQPNYRGSGGYGAEFYDLGVGQIGRAMQDDLDDAMDWAVAEGIADKARVCMVGGSYGGYAALWSVIRNPERYRCAASWAGVTDWDLILKYDRQFLTRNDSKSWRAKIEGEDFDLDTVSPYRLAEQLNRPVLLAHGTDDTRVPFSQFRKFSKAAEKAPVKPQELVIEDEGHSFSSPENEQAWYDALVAFLDRHNPAD